MEDENPSKRKLFASWIDRQENKLQEPGGQMKAWIVIVSVIIFIFAMAITAALMLSGAFHR